MKRFLLIIFSIIPMLSFAQDDVYIEKPLKKVPEAHFQYTNGRIVYETINTVTGISKAQIFALAKKWIADNFNSAKAVIQTEDATQGQIIGKATFDCAFFKGKNIIGSAITIKTSIQIDCKDGKYRIRFYDILEERGSLGGPLETYDSEQSKRKRSDRWNGLTNVINTKFTALMASFAKSITINNSDTF